MAYQADRDLEGQKRAIVAEKLFGQATFLRRPLGNFWLGPEDVPGSTLVMVWEEVKHGDDATHWQFRTCSSAFLPGFFRQGCQRGGDAGHERVHTHCQRVI